MNWVDGRKRLPQHPNMHASTYLNNMNCGPPRNSTLRWANVGLESCVTGRDYLVQRLPLAFALVSLSAAHLWKASLFLACKSVVVFETDQSNWCKQQRISMLIFLSRPNSGVKAEICMLCGVLAWCALIETRVVARWSHNVSFCYFWQLLRVIQNMVRLAFSLASKPCCLSETDPEQHSRSFRKHPHRSSDQNLTVHQCPSKPAKRHLAPEQAQGAGDEIWSKR